MIKVSVKGSFKNTNEFLLKADNASNRITQILNKYGQEGVNALSANTPKDTGKTSASWYYKLEKSPNGYSIVWCNSNIVDRVPIAIILEYGHGTRNGGYVQGHEYIEKSLVDKLKRIADEAWKEVTG